MSYLSLGDVHQYSGAGHVTALASYVGAGPGYQLTALGRPASRSLNPGEGAETGDDTADQDQPAMSTGRSVACSVIML